ncbi:MAG TPA: hypothetical protein VLY21_05795 [Nitrososphaerales archaeon]|nr:hypothetical protein [Nitrososphaerales archaeon]
MDSKTQAPNPGQADAVAVKIPNALASRITRRLSNSDFKTIDEYVAFVLDQVLTELEGNEPGANRNAENVFSKEDQASVEQRLRDLGYM